MPEINFPVHEQEVSPSREDKDHSALSRKQSVKKTPSFRNYKTQENTVVAGKLDRKTTLNQQNCEVKLKNISFIRFFLFFI